MVVGKGEREGVSTRIGNGNVYMKLGLALNDLDSPYDKDNVFLVNGIGSWNSRRLLMKCAPFPTYLSCRRDPVAGPSCEKMP